MSIAYPSTLPLPSINYSFEVKGRAIIGRENRTFRKARARDGRTVFIFSVNWLLTSSEKEEFSTFFKTTLVNGKLPFNIGLVSGEEAETHEVFFLNASHSKSIKHGLMFEVSARLVCHNPPMISKATLEETIAAPIPDSVPVAPVATAATGRGETGFTANWEAVAGAVSYRLDVSTSSGFTSFVSGLEDLNVGSGTSYVVPTLEGETTYFYRVRAVNEAGTSSNSNTITAATTGAVFAPSDLTDLALWLDGSDEETLYDATTGGSLVVADGTVARWEDKSGNARHALQATAANRPTRKTAIQGGKDVLRFSGSQWIVSQDFYTSNITIFTVSKATLATQVLLSKYYASDSTREFYFAYLNTDAVEFAKNADGSPGAHQAISKTGVGTGWNVLEAWKSGTSGEVAFNGTATAGTFATDGVYDGPNKWTVGSHAGGGEGTLPLNGDVAEVLIYSRALTSEERTQVQTYLQGKYFPLAAPVATAATDVAEDSFSANWGTVAGATGYELDVSTTSDFSSFVTGFEGLNVGNVLTYSVTGLDAGTSYFYRVRAVNTWLESDNSNSVTTQTTDPLMLHLEADSGVETSDGVAAPSSNGEIIEFWRDQSSYGNDAQQATLANRPTRQFISGNWSLFFDSANLQFMDLLSGFGMLRNKPGATILAVVEYTGLSASSQRRSVVEVQGGTSSTAPRVSLDTYHHVTRLVLTGKRLDSDAVQQLSDSAATYASDTRAVISGYLDWANANAAVWVNEVEKATADPFLTAGNSEDTDSLRITIGGNPDGSGSVYWNGYIYAIKVYDRILTTAERNAAISEWKTKYGIS